MPRTVRFAAVLLIVASLTSGSLQALPLSLYAGSIESGRGAFLATIAEWIVSLLAPDHPTGEAPQRPDAKAGSGYDPNGGPG